MSRKLAHEHRGLEARGASGSGSGPCAGRPPGARSLGFGGAFTALADDAIEEVVDDADELRLGFEYLFLRTSPLVAIRLGTWLDPEHRFAATGDDLLERATFRPGEDQLHLALGPGLGFERGQIDVRVGGDQDGATEALGRSEPAQPPSVISEAMSSASVWSSTSSVVRRRTSPICSTP